jgi:hypothetical protein
MPLLTAPPSKPQRGDRKNFAKMVDAFIAWLINFVGEMLALISSLNILASGSAYTFAYTVDLSSTADADPTSGKLRFNAANQNAATSLYLDLLGADGVDNTSMLDQLDGSTSTVKGQIRIVKQGDPTKFLTFDVMARTTATGYRKLTVANTGGSSANPFGANDAVLIKFSRTGDGGASWDPPVMYVRTEATSGAGGGSLVAGAWTPRTFNTTKRNAIAGASLSSGVVTLPAGMYEIEASAPGYTTNSHQVRLYNVTDSTVIEVGTSEYNFSTGNVMTRSSVRAYFTIAAGTTKTIRLDHWAQSSVSGSSGGVFTGSGAIEVYAEMKITKRA